jgi:hypothetical protein
LNKEIPIEMQGRWTEDEILERGRRLFEYAKAIWLPPQN